MEEHDISEAVKQAGVTVLEKLHADIQEGLEGLAPEALNWRPLPETNSIAGLLSHMVEASTYLLALGRGVPVQRDRDAQFAKHASDGAAFLGEVSAAWPGLIDAVRSYTGADLAAPREMRGRAVNGAWCLVHACEHLTEHWGQIQLTRDLYQARAAAGAE